MAFSTRFISATKKYATLTESVSAPYLRRSFTLSEKPVKAELLVCGLGFYELYVNGDDITKCPLAPYIAAPDDCLYYDAYDLTDRLTAGENVLGLCLGNGILNCFGGYVWDFQLARWRSAPKAALSLTLTMADGTVETIEADEQFVTAESPVFYDELRNGMYYDARREIPGWSAPGFDASHWKPAIPAETPRGEAMLCTADPLVVSQELSPVSVEPHQNGYLYDFGVNAAGLCRLKIRGEAGQTVSMYFGETLMDGKFYRRNVCFDDNDYVQKDVYICKGEGEETFVPNFTYHGYRYLYVEGLKPEQATPEALTYLVLHSDLKEMGSFSCSDPLINTLQEMTRRATLANFVYIPTDCPHREKNGWTADAALSTEHTLLNLDAANSYRAWLTSIRKAQNDAGALPGIVPTSGWGFNWGNGPAWDSVLTYVPYFLYIYYGNKQDILDNAHAILRYLEYLTTRIDEDGLIAIGLGDWCPPGRGPDDYQSPLCFTDTVVSMDICQKAAYLFGEAGLTLHQGFAQGLHDKLRNAVREKLLDLCTMTAIGNCQTSQAMAIFYGVFEPGERPAAFARLLEIIERDRRLMTTGVLGGRVLFHVLSEFGHSELAYDMITAPEFPSYKYWVDQGATALCEMFAPEDWLPASLNHHFWGDISHWFIRHLAGISYNPDRKGGTLNLTPSFVRQLDRAEAWHQAPEGRISVKWERQGDEIVLTAQIPEGLRGQILLDMGWQFADGKTAKPVASGEYRLIKA